MAKAIKITKFLGEAPKISPELLPDMVAQYAYNLDLSSGDLVPYRSSEQVATLDKTGEVLSIYPMVDPGTGELAWLHWTTDVNVATAQIEGDTSQRIYYTGDGGPKVTNFDLATSGPEYPAASYTLGLPLPTAVPVATPVAFATKSVLSYARDAGNTSTIVTTAAHGLTTGDYATIANVDDATFNLTNTPVTVINSTTFSYFSFGDQVATTTETDSGGYVAKAITSLARATSNTATVTTSVAHSLTTGDYVTIAGAVDTSYNTSSAKVTVTAPTTFTYVSTGAADTLSVSTAYQYSRDASNVATITTTAEHGLQTGDKVTLSGMAVPTFDAVNVTVQVVNVGAFAYYNPGAVVALAAGGGTITQLSTAAGADATVTKTSRGTVDLAGTVTPREYVFTYLTEWDEESIPSEKSAVVFVKEGQTVNISGLPATWTHGAGYNTTAMKVRVYRSVAGVTETTFFRVAELSLGTTTFVDDIDVSTLDEILTSEDNDAPPSDLKGLMAIHNNMIVGFTGSTLCFSEPGSPHAWPIKYRRQVDAEIVGLGAYGTTVLVLTNRTPWKVDGNNPEAVSMARTDYILPCISKRSIINIGFGVVWSSTGGLAVYSTNIGTDYLTKNVHSWTTWPEAVTPSALFGAYYRGRYFGSDGTNTFLFERNDQVGGHLVQSDIRFTAAHYKSDTDSFYYVDGPNVYLWNSPDRAPLTLDWKSKVFTTENYINLGAARVIADYNQEFPSSYIDDINADIEAVNQALIDGGVDMLGALGGSYANEHQVAGSNLLPQDVFNYAVAFQLFVNKVLVFSTIRYNSDPFRLPTGYRADTFEFRVATNVRIRAVHLAETASGLKGV